MGKLTKKFGGLISEAAEKQKSSKGDAAITLAARRWRVSLQVFIGIVILILVFINAVGLAIGAILPTVHLGYFSTFAVLNIVGKGLIFSAGVELVYMLFTPGPDEAVDPIILSVAATILLVVSDIHGIGVDENGDKLLKSALSVFMLAITVGGLFYVRHKFLESQASKSE